MSSVSSSAKYYRPAVLSVNDKLNRYKSDSTARNKYISGLRAQAKVGKKLDAKYPTSRARSPRMFPCIADGLILFTNKNRILFTDIDQCLGLLCMQIWTRSLWYVADTN